MLYLVSKETFSNLGAWPSVSSIGKKKKLSGIGIKDRYVWGKTLSDRAQQKTFPLSVTQPYSSDDASVNTEMNKIYAVQGIIAFFEVVQNCGSFCFFCVLLTGAKLFKEPILSWTHYANLQMTWNDQWHKTICTGCLLSHLNKCQLAKYLDITIVL